MGVHLISSKATPKQVEDMLEALETYIKLAVDVEREVLTGGGSLHSDCEYMLLEDGSVQEDVWGADWFPFTKQVTFESLINIRPSQNNFSMEVQDTTIREQIERITRNFFEGTTDE